MYSNDCYDCPDANLIMCKSCNKKVKQRLCDICDSEAKYQIKTKNGSVDYCEFCLDDFLSSEFAVLNVDDRIEALTHVCNYEIKKIDEGGDYD